MAGLERAKDFRKFRKESIKAKRIQEPVDFDMPNIADNSKNISKKKKTDLNPPINKLKEKLEKEAAEIMDKIEGESKMSNEEAAEKLVKAALGEKAFKEEGGEALAIPNLPEEINEFRSLGAAAAKKSEKEDNDSIPLGKSSLENELVNNKKENSIPLGSSSLESEDKKNKNKKEQFYAEYGPQGINIYGKKLFSNIPQEGWIMLNGFDDGAGKPIVSFSGEERKVDLEYFENLLGKYILKKKPSSSKNNKEEKFNNPTQKNEDEFEAQSKTFGNGGKTYKDESVPDDFKDWERDEKYSEKKEQAAEMEDEGLGYWNDLEKNNSWKGNGYNEDQKQRAIELMVEVYLCNLLDDDKESFGKLKKGEDIEEIIKKIKNKAK